MVRNGNSISTDLTGDKFENDLKDACVCLYQTIGQLQDMQNKSTLSVKITFISFATKLNLAFLPVSKA